MSQTALAGVLGVRPSAVSHFETGRNKPSPETLCALADALGTTTDYLLGRERKMQPAGPQAEHLLKLLPEIRAEDLELLVRFAEDLARRSRR